jgi:glycosyltransferase involved in cell wall biosynthesis
MRLLRARSARQQNSCDSQSDLKLRVLIIAPYFYPAVLAGGPIQALGALTDRLQGEINFYVLALNHDLKQRKTFPNIADGTWGKSNGVYIRYEPDRRFTFRHYSRWIRETNPDVVYIKTFFTIRFCLVPVLMVLTMRRPRPQIILAPCGSLMFDALRFKRTKKAVYLFLYRLLRLPSRTHWHVTSTNEFDELLHTFKNISSIHQASSIFPVSEMMPADYLTRSTDVVEKESGELRVIFISRISPKKNLEYAIQRLASIRGSITFTIAGPHEDAAYVSKCRELARQLPSNVAANFIGPISHDDISSLLARHHLFFLPTLAENYGYVIVEAIATATPVLISEGTPWRNLRALGLGFDLPLSDPRAFEEVLQYMCDLDNFNYLQEVETMKMALPSFFKEQTALADNLEMFRDVASHKSV